MRTAWVIITVVAGLLAAGGSVSAQTITSQQADQMTEGNGFSVNGTPTFFVGKTTAQGIEGFRIVGAQPYAVFQQRLDALLK